MKKIVNFFVFLLALFAVSASPVCADSLIQGDILFGLNQVYSGSATPIGAQPWLTAAFTNLDPIDGNYRVQLTMGAGNLSTATTQFVDSWFFNVTDTLPALGLLSFQYVSGDQATIFRGRDSLEAGGGLSFDLEFLFDVSPFSPGESSTYLISSTQRIDALSFSFLSTNSLGLTNYYSSANILGLDGGPSWIAAQTAQTPGPGPAPIAEPASIILLGLGLGGLTVFGRKKLFA